MEDNDAFTVPAGAAEAFKAAGEPFAQGLCEEPGRSPTYRYANAFRRFWEQAALVPYDGGRLYPCGPNVWSARVNDCAMRPHFGLSRTYDCDWERLSQKAPEAAAALRADHEKVTPVPPPHRVGGGGFCHSFPNYARLLAEGFAGYRRRVEALPAGDFRDAMLVVLDGIGTYRRRCLGLLRSSGAPAELIDALEHVPEEPPRDIYEALVAWNFIYYVDGCDDIGALDRNLVPYFRGEDIVPLLRELFANVDANDAWSGPLGPDCNEITLQCLRAIRGMRRPGLQLLVRRDTPDAVWRKALEAYLGTSSETKICEVEDKARIIGYTRMIRRSIRRKGLESEKGRAEIALWKQELLELLDRTDTLLFSFNELEIDAEEAKLAEVQTFVEERLEAVDCPMKALMQINVAVEEIFVNIASYAYVPEKGKAKVRVEISGEPVSVTITFEDRGIPYDPVAREDPDITLPASQRDIGGLGIFMTKQIMDDVAYEYRDGQNILTLKKRL